MVAKKNTSASFRVFIRVIPLLLLCFGMAGEVWAATLTVTPAIIDMKAKARDILKESVTLANNTQRKLIIYAFVNNIAVVEGKQEFLDPSKADYASSLANWIKISRGVIELSPGEKRAMDFLIEVNLRAKAGMYHSVISFAEGSTRDEAEAVIYSAPSLMVNVEVKEDIKERLQLKKFIPDRTFSFGFPVSFSYEFENVGNRPVTPVGEIRIYNRRGEEITTINVNESGSALNPDETVRIASVWREESKESKQGAFLASVMSGLGGGGGFGRYKAFLDLEYGSEQRGTMQDTIYFWVFPWQKILVIFGGMAMATIMFMIFLRRRFNQGRSGETRINTRIDAERPNVIDLRDIRKP